VSGLLAGLRRRRRPAAPVLDPTDPRLAVVVRSTDPAASDVAVVAEAVDSGAADPGRPALVRHLLTGLGAEALPALAAALDASYAVVEAEPLVVQRVQGLSGLGLAQERTRMAALAQRLGGDALGWEALQVPVDTDR
jgi:hypothetical protein